MGKKKVLFVLHLPPPLHGASIMGKYIKESHAVNNRYDCHFVNLSSSIDIENIGKFSLNKIYNYFDILHSISREIKCFRPDLVYVTPNSSGLALYKDYLVLKLIKKSHAKIVTHFHNKGFKELRGGVLMKLFLKSYFHGLKVILLSNHLYDDVKGYVSHDNVYFCYNGIPDIRYEYQLKQNNPIRLLFLSNMFINKGVLVLLDALKILSDMNISFVCDLVGSETDELNKEKIEIECKKRRIENIVFYHGRKENDEKQKFYKKADIFLFPSLKECFSLVLLEAMQFGLPCISTNEGGIKDIIEDGVTGFIVPKGSSSILAEKTSLLIKNKDLREKMGRQGRMRYEEKFRLPIFENKLCNIFDDLFSL